MKNKIFLTALSIIFACNITAAAEETCPGSDNPREKPASEQFQLISYRAANEEYCLNSMKTAGGISLQLENKQDECGGDEEKSSSVKVNNDAWRMPEPAEIAWYDLADRIPERKGYFSRLTERVAGILGSEGQAGESENPLSGRVPDDEDKFELNYSFNVGSSFVLSPNLLFLRSKYERENPAGTNENKDKTVTILGVKGQVAF